MSTIRADNYGDRLGSFNLPAATLAQGTAKSWLNLDGTGTISVRDSFNVSSNVDNGTGDYTVNFSAAFPNANYMMSSSGTDLVGCTDIVFSSAHTPATNSVRIRCLQPGSYGDSPYVLTSFFGDPA